MAVKSTTTCITCRCEIALRVSNKWPYETSSAYRTARALGLVVGLGPLCLAGNHFNSSTHTSGGVTTRKGLQRSHHSAYLMIAGSRLLSSCLRMLLGVAFGMGNDSKCPLPIRVTRVT